MSSTPTGLSGKKRKVLVYLFGSLGDSIVAIPALRSVRRHFADAEIVLLQNFESEAVVLASQVIPPQLVDRYISYSSKPQRQERIKGFVRLWLQLREERFDAAVYLVISERPAKAVARDRLFFRSAGMRELIGFHAISPDELYPLDARGRPARSPHEAEFKLRRLERDGMATNPESDLRVPLLELDEIELAEIGEWISARRFSPGVPLVSMAAGCKTRANEWPVESFAELGRRLISQHGYEIVVTGGKGDTALGTYLTESWGRGINAAGELSVRQSAALLSRCSFHIGLDTGTTHLAAAVGTRCFAIYGERNNPGHWYPPGDGHMLLFHAVPCAGCRFEVCPVPGHPCMQDISAESAWLRLEEFLGSAEISQGVKAIAV